MAIVSDIVDQAEALMLGVLTSAYKKLRFVQDLSRNDEKDAKKAYGVRPLSAEPASGGTIINSETLDHTFEFILSDVIARGDSDDECQAILDVLYAKADLIFKQFVNTRMNLASTVLRVEERSMSEPEVLKETYVFLRARFVVKYRQSLA